MCVVSFLVFGIEQYVPQALFAIASGFLLNYDYLFYSKALQKADTSHVVPLFYSYPIIVLAINLFIFGETISMIQFASFMVILFGVLVLSVESIGLRRR